MKHRHYKICSIQTVLRHKLSIQEEDMVILITLIIIKNIPNVIYQTSSQVWTSRKRTIDQFETSWRERGGERGVGGGGVGGGERERDSWSKLLRENQNSIFIFYFFTRTERQTDRQTETGTDRDSETERDRERQRGRERQRQEKKRLKKTPSLIWMCVCGLVRIADKNASRACMRS